MKTTIQKQGDCYFPHTVEDLELHAKLPDNSLYVVDIKRSRNPQFHRYAFAMFQRMFDMVDTDLAFDPWRKMLLIKAGFFTAIGSVDIKGTVSQAVIADSMSFEAMEETEFHAAFSAIHQAFISKYGNILTHDQLTEWSTM